jgi:hypothetical protein
VGGAALHRGDGLADVGIGYRHRRETPRRR